MAAISEQFEMPSKMKTWSMVFIIIGVIAFILGLITKGVKQRPAPAELFSLAL